MNIHELTVFSVTSEYLRDALTDLYEIKT